MIYRVHADRPGRGFHAARAPFGHGRRDECPGRSTFMVRPRAYEMSRRLLAPIFVP